jgi:hypothetical protein
METAAIKRLVIFGRKARSLIIFLSMSKHKFDPQAMFAELLIQVVIKLSIVLVIGENVRKIYLKLTVNHVRTILAFVSRESVRIPMTSVDPSITRTLLPKRNATKLMYKDRL